MKNQSKHKHLKPLLAVLVISAVVLGVSLSSGGSVFQGAFHAPAPDGVLAVGLMNNPSSHAVTKGAEGVPSVGFSLYASHDTDITVNQITLTGYVDAGDGVFLAGEDDGGDADGTVALSDMISSVELYELPDRTLISTAESFGAGDDEITFMGLNWTIPAGTNGKFVAVVDLLNYSTGSSPDSYTFDIADAENHIGAVDADGNDFNAENDAVNGGNSPTVAVTVEESGAIEVSSAHVQVPDHIVMGNDFTNPANPLLVGRYHLFAEREEIKMEELQFDSIGSNDNAIDYVILKYPTDADDPTNLDGETTVTLVAGKADFSGLDVAVPHHMGGADIELFVTTNEIGSGAYDGDVIQFAFDHDAGVKAVGQTSGVTITESSSEYTGTAAEGGAITLDAGFLRIATDNKDPNCPSSVLTTGSSVAVYCFVAKASGDATLELLNLNVEPDMLLEGNVTGELGETDGWEIFDIHDLATPLGNGTYSGGNVTIAFDPAADLSDEFRIYIVKAPVQFDPMRAGAASLNTYIERMMFDGESYDSGDLDFLPTEGIALSE